VEVLVAVLLVLGVVALLYEVSERIGVPYPALLVVAGLGLALVPDLPQVALQPDLVLLVFLPPLLFSAAAEIPMRELRANLAPITRLSIGLVIATIVVVALAVHTVLPSVGWGPAFVLGAIVSPTDAIAATTVFRRLRLPRQLTTIIEGESLVNDATALVAYRAALAAVATGTFLLSDAVFFFVVSAIGGIAIGIAVGYVAQRLMSRLDNPPVEVAIGLVTPFAAYLPADVLGISGVLAAVAAGLVVSRKLGSALTPNSRLLWVGTWRMLGFVLNGFVFVLIGLALPDILSGLQHPSTDILTATVVVCLTVVITRFTWIYLSGLIPNSPARVIDKRYPGRGLKWRVSFLASWAGLRGAVSLAAALALPENFPERPLILFLTFAVILVTLLGQGLTLPLVVRFVGNDRLPPDEDEATLAQGTALRAGIEEVERLRELWPTHLPLLDRLDQGMRDRKHHLATADPTETEERRQERLEHLEIQRHVITAQRVALTELRNRAEINDETLRDLERELDLEEIRMEG
jgi:monovalent cation/hydrogen antiporter